MPATRAGAVTFFALILVGTLMPGVAKHSLLSHFPGSLHIDKIGHAAGFLSMSFCLARSRLAGVRVSHMLVFALALAAFTEFCQNFIPGRTPTVVDVCIDVIGASFGLWLASLRITRA